MDDMEDRSVWQETTGAVARQAEWGRPSTRPTVSSHAAALANITNLTPADDCEFVSILTPCLQLVAPVGMTLDAQDTWFEAARLALAEMPADLLRRGAKAAMSEADHPAKIVPAIMRAVGDDLAWRRRNQRASAERDAGAMDALPAPGQESVTAAEVDAICKRFGVGRYSAATGAADPSRPAVVATHADPNRPCRAPTREDYIRLGVDPAVLDEIESKRGKK